MFEIGFDVRKAYLNATLPDGKKLYSRCPPGYEKPGKVLQWNSAIYGAPPSARAWYDTNVTALAQFPIGDGLRPLKTAPSIFVNSSERGTILLGVNTDDGICLATDQKLLEEFRTFYDAKFSVRWGHTDKFGGINVEVDEEHHTVKLHQHDFVDAIWDKWRHRVSPSRPGGDRGIKSTRLPATRAVDDLVSPQALQANLPCDPKLLKEYQSCLGDYGWACRTRDDHLCTFSKFAQAASCPNETIFQELLTAIYNMKCHPTKICFAKSTYDAPVGYSDADLGVHRSQTGYVFYYGNAPVIAGSKVQHCTTLSACESELVALSAAACEGQWLRNLLIECGKDLDKPTPIYCDNSAARMVAHNPTSAKNLKHVARRHFFVQDLVSAGEITVPGVSSNDNIADIFTKLYDHPSHFEFLAGRLRSWTSAA